MAKEEQAQELDKVVIRFAGDSGDGMQLTGSQFTFTSAILGNDLSTFPDFPAEIRAPLGTLEGVSGFQVQIGKVDVYTPGDKADVLVAMNPAALKTNIHWIRNGGNIIVDTDAFTAKNLKKAGYESNPLEDGSMAAYNLVNAPISSMTKTALENLAIDAKTVFRSKNMFALGIMYWLFDRSTEPTEQFLESKFKKAPLLIEANKKALHAGYFYAETVEALPSHYKVASAKINKGKYRHISGNIATAWGLMAAAEKTGKKLFYGSYPITPATDILHELSRYKNLGVISLQAEDEIAAVCSAIGASYAGEIGVTASSGPGIALKGEAMGLAVMAELPLVIVNVQRGGPSTGLPTKTEQADLNQALYGRNSQSPMIIVAASTPSNCFAYAYEAVRLAFEHMSPVMLLTDGYLANGSEPWKYPSMSDLAPINVRIASPNGESYMPYARDPETLVREFAAPGMEGLEHRIGGLEKAENSGNVSYDSDNHQKMTELREEKIANVANNIPEQEVVGNGEGDVLVIGWGGTYGALLSATKELQRAGHSVDLAHFNYICPLPKNTKDILSNYKHILVCELNLGQFANYLTTLYPMFKYIKYTKVKGQPFSITEIKEKVLELI